MTKIVRKIFITAFVGISILTASQLTEAVAIVEHKEIQKNNYEVLFPSVKKGASSDALKSVNTALDKIVNGRLDGYLPDVKQAPKAQLDRYAFYSSYAVKFNKNDLLSIAVDSYQYTGGAHGMKWKDSVTADLRTGKLLKLGDLFKLGSGYEEILNQKIKNQITAKEFRKADLSFTGVDNETKFYLTEELLVIYYQPYEIAPYVYGIVSFYINNSDLDGIYKDEIATMLQKP